MFRLWGKIFKDNHMLRDTVIEDDRNDTRTHKIFDSLDATTLISANRSGSIPIFRNSNATAKLVFTRIVL